MTVAVVLAAVWAVLGLGALVLFVSMCVCGARDDRLMEAWRAERESADAALNAEAGGWRN